MSRTMLAIALAYALGTFAQPATAKGASQVPVAGEPEYAGIYAERDPATGHYTQLERLTPTKVVRARFFGFGGGDARIEFPNEASTIRFKANQPIEFILRVASQDKDPASFIQFWVMTPLKGHRVMQIANVGGMGIKAEDTTQAHAVPYMATRFGEHFFRVISQQPLPPGEYSLSTSEDRDGFCFGIDP